VTSNETTNADIELSADEGRELVKERADLEAFRRALLTGEIEVEVDPEAIARRIMAEIIDAPSVEDAFSNPTIVSARDAIGQAYELRGINVHASSFDSGGVFVSVDAVDLATGERVILNTSAAKMLAKLYVLERDHAWPVKVRVVQALRPTASGYYPLDFELVAEQPEA
jgi:hypothetical protein